MNWLVTIVIGGIVGWLASMVMKTNAQMGLIANVIVGIIGLEHWILARRNAGTVGFRPDHRLGDRHRRRRAADPDPEEAGALQVG